VNGLEIVHTPETEHTRFTYTPNLPSPNTQPVSVHTLLECIECPQKHFSLASTKDLFDTATFATFMSDFIHRRLYCCHDRRGLCWDLWTSVNAII